MAAARAERRPPPLARAKGKELPPPPLPPDPRIVREGSYNALDRNSLREATTKLKALFSEEPTALLDLTWRLRRKGDE